MVNVCVPACERGVNRNVFCNTSFGDTTFENEVCGTSDQSSPESAPAGETVISQLVVFVKIGTVTVVSPDTTSIDCVRSNSVMAAEGQSHVSHFSTCAVSEIGIVDVFPLVGQVTTALNLALCDPTLAFAIEKQSESD